MGTTSRNNAVDRRGQQRLGQALAWWVGFTLSGVVLIAGLSIWHLVRRGRRLRERLGPPRKILWPDLTPTPPANNLETPPQ